MKKEIPTLTAQKRDGTKPNVLRKAGKVPGIIYGKVENTNVLCELKTLTKMFNTIGESQVLELDLDGTKIPCLFHSLAFEPVTGAIEHVDFYAVDMTKKVTTHVPVHLKGEAPVVKSAGGVLMVIHNEIEVTCLPKDLPSEFAIDLSNLKTFEDAVFVSDLTIPEGVTLKYGPETMIIHIQAPRKEEVKAVVAEAAATPDAKAATAAGDKKEEVKK